MTEQENKRTGHSQLCSIYAILINCGIWGWFTVSSPKINECMNKLNYYVSFHSYRFMAWSNKDKTEQQKCPQVLCTVTSRQQGDIVQGYGKVFPWLQRTWSWESAKIHAEEQREQVPPLGGMHCSTIAGALARAQKEGTDTAGLTILPCLSVVSSRKCST